LIRLTRINGQPITVNSDLIKFIDNNPDTLIALVSGDKILVLETAEEVVARVVEFKRAVITGLLMMSIDPVALTAALTAAVSRPRDEESSQDPEAASRG
jgi:flagellar protein FlbD